MEQPRPDHYYGRRSRTHLVITRIAVQYVVRCSQNIELWHEQRLRSETPVLSEAVACCKQHQSHGQHGRLTSLPVASSVIGDSTMQNVRFCILSVAVSMIPAPGSMAGEWEPCCTHWERAGLAKGSSAVTGFEWADQRLGLGAYDSEDSLVVSPRDSVSPYEHLAGRMNLVSRSGSVDSQVIVFREIRGKDEYIKRLGDVEFGFDQRRKWNTR